MIITPKFHYDLLDRTTQPTGERVYVTPFGVLPSVTTILSSTSDNAGLAAWREFVGEAKANKIRDEATGLGSLMHEHLECHIQGIERPRGTNLVRAMARKMADTIINNGLTGMDEVWGIESPLYFPEKYAGTTDLLGVYKGENAICDYKTSSKPKTVDQIGDYKLQLAAYAEAHDVMYGTTINTGVIFMVCRDLQHMTFVFSGDEFKQAKRDWWLRVDKYYDMIASQTTSA